MRRMFKMMIKEYLRIKKLAKSEDSDIFWGDKTEIRNDEAKSRSYAPKSTSVKQSIRYAKKLIWSARLPTKGELISCFIAKQWQLNSWFNSWDVWFIRMSGKCIWFWIISRLTIAKRWVVFCRKTRLSLSYFSCQATVPTWTRMNISIETWNQIWVTSHGGPKEN